MNFLLQSLVISCNIIIVVLFCQFRVNFHETHIIDGRQCIMEFSSNLQTSQTSFFSQSFLDCIDFGLFLFFGRLASMQDYVSVGPDLSLGPRLVIKSIIEFRIFIWLWLGVRIYDAFWIAEGSFDIWYTFLVRGSCLLMFLQLSEASNSFDSLFKV